MKPKFNPSSVFNCQICGCDGRWLPLHVCKRMGITRLVRDHCHRTGFIRGMLCDRCNVYLGLLESNPEAYYDRWPEDIKMTDYKGPNRIKLSKWRKWVSDYTEKIYAHMQSNTGLKYQP